jgi:hypothetical protein
MVGAAGSVTAAAAESGVEGVAAPEASGAAGFATSFPVMASSTEGSGTVAISSVPDAAEIYIDGKFHGNTPATVKLPAGAHTVVLQFSGRPDYSRTMEIPKASKLSRKAIFEPPTS